MNIHPDNELEWFDRYSEGKLTEHEAHELQTYLKDSPEHRKRFRQYLRLDAYLQIQSQSHRELDKADLNPKTTSIKVTPIIKTVPIFFSAAALLLVALTAVFLFKSSHFQSNISEGEVEESQLKGYAVIRHSLNDEWSGLQKMNVGDLISEDTIELSKGLLQIDFFCGASVVLEGPAKLEIKSAWAAICHEGNLRAVVPPAARGFRIHTAQGEIEDLGTEFSVSVKDNQSRVHVLDGKVLVHQENQDTVEMNTGDQLNVTIDGLTQIDDPALTIAGLEEVRTGAFNVDQISFRRWQQHRDELAKDQRLRAYFPMDRQHWKDNTIENISPISSEASNDAIMLGFANQHAGRFPQGKLALDVRRPDARARVYIEGEFKAYTFFTWVRIDSLAHQYNALFMGDNYNNGEPHWQIRDDGKLMMSVMVREKDRGLKPNYHLVYFSPVFWDDSLSGKWIQLASTYDPIKREVANYFNGKLLNKDRIKDEFYIENLKIGGAEIGSWGLPFRAEDTHFALRNLNGLIDEFMIFDAALTAEEIRTLYEKGKP